MAHASRMAVSSSLLPKRHLPWRNWTALKRGTLIGGFVLLLLVASLAWWLFSPLFLHTTSHDANPFARTASAQGQPGSVILATGSFIDRKSSGVGLNNDHGSGNVTIGKTANGEYLLHLDHLNITNGPDLHVYLAPTSTATDAGQVKQEGVDLGHLRATEGSLNVAIPTTLAPNLKRYHSVVIVCKTFSVIFTTAPITFSP